jgi:hypothetical protein
MPPHFCMDMKRWNVCVRERGRRGGKEVVAGLTGVFRKWEIILRVCFLWREWKLHAHCEIARRLTFSHQFSLGKIQAMQKQTQI